MTHDERSLTAAGGSAANSHNPTNGSVEPGISLELLSDWTETIHRHTLSYLLLQCEQNYICNVIWKRLKEQSLMNTHWHCNTNDKRRGWFYFPPRQNRRESFNTNLMVCNYQHANITHLHFNVLFFPLQPKGNISKKTVITQLRMWVPLISALAHPLWAHPIHTLTAAPEIY